MSSRTPPTHVQAPFWVDWTLVHAGWILIVGGLGLAAVVLLAIWASEVGP